MADKKIINLEKKFKRGDMVRWTSSAAGTDKTKIGKIIEIVQPDCTPSYEIFGSIRAHKSYLVSVVQSGKAKPKIYWPIASKLELVSVKK